jgi:hypothetical protein
VGAIVVLQLHEAALLVRQVRTLLLLHVPALLSACRISATARRDLARAARQRSRVAPRRALLAHAYPLSWGSRGARHRARTRDEVDYHGHGAAAHGARVGWSHAASRPARHTRRRVTPASHPHAWLLARARCSGNSGQGWNAQFAGQDKQRHAANAPTTLGAPRLRPRPPPLPPPTSTCSVGATERMAVDEQRRRACPTNATAIPGPGRIQRPARRGGPSTTTHRVAAGAKLRSFESIMAAVWYDPSQIRIWDTAVYLSPKISDIQRADS